MKRIKKVFNKLISKLKKEKVDSNNEETIYFVEKPADVDLLGYDSYAESLNNAIDQGAKFIGLISDYGNGKSTLLKMIDNGRYRFAYINLWNCDEKKAPSKIIDIHRNFLHQLIDQLEIKNPSYYKKKIDKKYWVFDIKFKNNNKFYFGGLLFFLILSFFDSFGLTNVYGSGITEIHYHIFIACLAILNIIIYKPVVSFKKNDSSEREIDENDTKDLYNEIKDCYFDENKKPLIICLEELDRYNDSDKVLEYLKEFYKFYNSSPNKKIIFIIAIKSASKLMQTSDDENNSVNKTKEIKEIYEKIFDFILHLRSVNIHDFDSIVFDLIKSKEESLKKICKLPNKNNLREWKYLYIGEDIKIRDIKHRYNFAISLYLSASSAYDNISIEKCLFMAYLEDEHNDLFNILSSNSELLNNILIKYVSERKDITVNMYEELKAVPKSIDALNEGLKNKYLGLDYNHYFYKFPKSKKAYNIYEYSLFNAIFYDEDNELLSECIKKLNDTTICNLIDKRARIYEYPEIIFKYIKLFELICHKKNKDYIEGTIRFNYNIVYKLDKAVFFLSMAKKLKQSSFGFVIDIYKEVVFNDIISLSVDRRLNIRKELVRILKDDVFVFSDLFFGDNELISLEEIKWFKKLGNGVELINFEKIDTELLNGISTLINTRGISKVKLINLLKKIADSNCVSPVMYSNFIYSLDLKKYNLSPAQCNQLFSVSQNKLFLSVPKNFNLFVYHLNHYSSAFDKHYLSILNTNNSIDMSEYALLVNEFNSISSDGLETLNNYAIRTGIYFDFNANLRDIIYDFEYYAYYVNTTVKSTGLFDFEYDKKANLINFYVEFFENDLDMNYDISSNMINELYEEIDFFKLSSEKLLLFVKKIQTENLINAVLNTKNNKFINAYLSRIKYINKNEIFDIYFNISKYKNDFGLKKNTISNLKRIISDEKILRLLDGRRKTNYDLVTN